MQSRNELWDFREYYNNNKPFLYSAYQCKVPVRCKGKSTIVQSKQICFHPGCELFWCLFTTSGRLFHNWTSACWKEREPYDLKSEGVYVNHRFPAVLYSWTKLWRWTGVVNVCTLYRQNLFITFFITRVDCAEKYKVFEIRWPSSKYCTSHRFLVLERKNYKSRL